MFNATKIIISALIIFIASEIAKKDTLVGAIIVSLPLISLLSIIWIYIETRDIERIISFSYSIFSMIIKIELACEVKFILIFNNYKIISRINNI